MLTMTKRVLIAGLALLPLGCSFYYSSESSVKTLTSPSRSSGSSSGDEDDDESEKKAYRDDVRDFTAAYAVEFDDLDGFEDGLAGVARRHGITDWEADAATYTAVGAGLRRADVGRGELARYEALVARDEPAKAALLRRGYAPGSGGS
jgi:hypothetical protein